MNILFMTIGQIESIKNHTIYCDLLRCFCNHGHNVYTISPHEKRTGLETKYDIDQGVHMLRIATGNITEAPNLIKKGIVTLSIEQIYIKGIKKYFPDVKFDLVLYSTPPITFSKAIEYIKKRDGAKTYLLLKDIFPQNAVDLCMITTIGLKSLIYKFFRYKEKKLYAISDRIGCMSQANVDYVIKHNPEVDPEIVEVCPNSIEVIDKSVGTEVRRQIREKYGIPLDKKVFVYGGNLGKPQGIDFLIKCLRAQHASDAFFLIVGDGTEYGKLEWFVSMEKPANVMLMKRLPKDDYDTMVAACDVGMIFLDYRFTIPNFPSRLLSYMQAKLPILAVTDVHTDIGKAVVEGGLGWWCKSNCVEEFGKLVDTIIQDHTDRHNIIFDYLKKYYSVEKGYNIIMRHLLVE